MLFTPSEKYLWYSFHFLNLLQRVSFRLSFHLLHILPQILRLRTKILGHTLP